MADSSIMNNSEYDLDWSDFIGNATAVKQLRVAAQSAAARGVNMPHTLLEGGSGNGKTTLAVLVARGLGAEVKTVAGPVKAVEARMILSSCMDGDVLFWDEFHGCISGGKSKVDWLLSYLQDGVIVTAAGEEAMPRVTVIAATNEVGKIPETVLSRFQLRPALVDYTEDEAAVIAAKMSSKVFGALTLPNEDVLRQVSIAGNYNPRLIKQILANVRDLAIVNGTDVQEGQYPLVEALDMMGLSPDGLDNIAREYLMTLLRFPAGLGANAINEILGTPGGVGPTERMLQRRELIMKLKTGRVLSPTGIRRANALKREAVAAQATHSVIA